MSISKLTSIEIEGIEYQETTEKLLKQNKFSKTLIRFKKFSKLHQQREEGVRRNIIKGIQLTFPNSLSPSFKGK